MATQSARLSIRKPHPIACGTVSIHTASRSNCVIIISNGLIAPAPALRWPVSGCVQMCIVIHEHGASRSGPIIRCCVEDYGTPDNIAEGRRAGATATVTMDIIVLYLLQQLPEWDFIVFTYHTDLFVQTCNTYYIKICRLLKSPFRIATSNQFKLFTYNATRYICL